MKIHEISGEIGGDYVVCDITKKEDIDAMTSKVVDLHGKLDIGSKLLAGVIYHPFLRVLKKI